MRADIGIIICTYRRPVPLERAIASVFSLEPAPSVTFDLTVVDNSDDGSARAVVERMREGAPVSLAYLNAHPANISVARNAGVEAARSPVIAFLDDDETFHPGWLKAVAAALADMPHDVFFGAVEPAFEDDKLATPGIRTLYSRKVPGAAGTDLYAMGPRKTPTITLGTNNSIFRRARAFDGPDRFDPAFGDAGGEDYDLFCRLQARGLRFGWLPDARVTEDVPASRCDRAYLRRRSYAGGQVYAAAAASADRSPGRARWLIRAKAAAQAALLGASALAWPLKSPDARDDLAIRFAGVLGKMSFGGAYPLYRENDPK